jgi:heat shock protein HslJ
MSFIRLGSGRRFVVCGVLLAALVAQSEGRAQPSEGFPFDQELLLNATPMRPGKRMPSITVERNGNAVIDLWCKSVPAHVEFSDSGMKIETPILPDELPQMQSGGQCTPERMAADATLLEKFSGVTAWQREGGAIVLNGPVRMKFSAPAN